MVDSDLLKGLGHNILIAKSFSAKGEYAIAVNIFTDVINRLKEVDLSDDYDTQMLLAGVYLRRGMAKHNLEHYSDAIEDYSVANRMYSVLAGKGLLFAFIDYAETFLSRSYTYLKTSEYQKALKDSDSAAVIYNIAGVRKGSELEWNLARAYMIKGVSLRNLEFYEKSQESLQKAIELLKELYKTKNDDRIGRDLILTYVDMGNVMEDIEDYDKAMEYYNKAKELFDNIYVPGVLWVYDDFSTPYHTRDIVIPTRIYKKDN